MAGRSLLRRSATVLAVLLALPLWLVTIPIWVPVTLIVDAASRLWRLPTLRLGIFAGVYLVHSWIGLAAAGWLWLTGRFGRRLDLSAHRRVQAWWASSLLTWAGRLLGVRFHFDDPRTLPSETFVMLSRHASMIDAVIPATLVTGDLDRYIHYVLKRELRWEPTLDLFGTRLGNHFVARGDDTGNEQAEIHAMAVRAQASSALVIFPEGTYATPRSRQRVLESLRRRADLEVVARAEALQALLPPKPAGTLALLRGRPEADVVVVGHVGLEGVAELRGLRQRLPLDEPVRIRWWTHRREHLPIDDEALVEWLGERWLELDRWVVTVATTSTVRLTGPNPAPDRPV